MIDIANIVEYSIHTRSSGITIGTRQKKPDPESIMYMERLKDLLEQWLKEDTSIQTSNPKNSKMQLTYKPCNEDVWVQIYCKQSDDAVYGTARKDIAKSYFMCNRGDILDMKPSNSKQQFRLLAVSKASNRLQYSLRTSDNKELTRIDTFLAAITFGAYCTDEAREIIKEKGLNATGSDKKNLEYEQCHIQVHHRNAYENTKGSSPEETLAFDCNISNIECTTLPEHQLAHTDIDIAQDDTAMQQAYAKKSSRTHSGKVQCDDDRMQVTINAEVEGGREIVSLLKSNQEINSTLTNYFIENNFAVFFPHEQNSTEK